MKAYFIYLIFPVRNLQNISRMMPNKYQWNETNDPEYGSILYAWTPQKKMKNRFLSYRDKDLYHVETVEFDNIETMRNMVRIREIDGLELVDTSFFNGDEKEKIGITCTFNEWNICTNEPDEYLEEYFISIFDKGATDYIFMKDKYQNALDRIGYTFYYDVLYGGNPLLITEDERDERESLAQDASSYGTGPLGSPTFNFNQHAQVSIFSLLFNFAIYKDYE